MSDGERSHQTEQPYDAELDAIGSYYAAIAAIGEAVKAGAPVPDYLLPLGAAS